MNKKYAFTLAEVLVTLMIVGIVASMTIPALIKSIEDIKFKSMWKKSFAILSLATNLAINDYGGATNLVVPYWPYDEFRDKYLNYIKIIKKCELGTSFGNCFAANADIKFKNGNPLGTAFGTDASGVILNNGTAVIFQPYSGGCTSTKGDYHNVCGWMAVDVNNVEGPNVVGRDIYAVWLLSDRLVPWGVPTDDRVNTCSTYGYSCSAEYLYQ